MHNYFPRIRFWSWISAIEITMVRNCVLLPVQFNLLCYILNPGFYFLSITPSIATVKPCPMLIWNHSGFNSIRASRGSTRVCEHTRVFILAVNYKSMRSYAEFRAVIVVTAVSCYHSINFDFFRVFWNCKLFSMIFAVVVFIESASFVKTFNLVRL